MSEVVSLTAHRSVESRPALVRLYEDRAEVVRRATIDVARGYSWIAVPGVTALLDDRTVQAEIVAEGARVVSVRVVRRARPKGELGSEEVDAIETAAQALEDRLHETERGEVRANADLERSSRAFGDWLEGIERVPELDGDGRTRWTSAYETLDAADRRAVEKARASAHEQLDIRETGHALAAKLDALRTERPRIDAVVEVQLSADRQTTGQLEVRYRTPCAVWRPEHAARLSTSGERARIDVVTFATVWQATGEDWTDVELELSTARPARAASAPLLDEDRIRSRKKTDEEKKSIVVESREQEVQIAGVHASTRAVDEMPGVDDGGEPLSYRTPGRVSVPSIGRPHRFEIAKATMDASVQRVLIPERAGAAHWRARATLAGDRPLLAGPARITRNGSAVGRSKLDFVGKGEAFELGFGPDDGVRVRRSQQQKRDRTPLIGTQKIERTVTLFLSNLSGEAKDVLVIERIPVSEIDDVEIALSDGAAEWKLDHRDGFLERKVVLSARETKEIGYAYEIRAKSNVELPF